MQDNDEQDVRDAYLAKLDARIARLTALRAMVESDGGASDDDNGAVGGPGRSAATETRVHPGSFLGMSVPQATRRFLGIMGKERPQTPQQIANALVLGNQDKPDNEAQVLKNVYTAIKRGKDKEGGFKKVGKLWGLAEWYPAGARNTDEAPAKRRKAKKRGKASRPTPLAPIPIVPGKITYPELMAQMRKAGKSMQEVSEAWKAIKAQ